MPLRASASALTGKPSPGRPGSPASSGRSQSNSARARDLEAEVAALRQQLSEQAEGHQSDMSALRAEQALRRAALEDALRAESAESERRLCLQFAEEATAFKVQADISLQQAEAQSRAAMRREMGVLRRQLEGLKGIILLVGPPCAGKTTHAEVMAAQLGLTHVSLPSLLAELHESGDDDQISGSTSSSSPAPIIPPVGPKEALRHLLHAAASADNSLLLLECPSDYELPHPSGAGTYSNISSSVLPSLLMHIVPLLVLLIDAKDTACTRRIQRRRKSNNQPPLPASQLASTLHAFRSTDERLSRSFGAKNPGQLCVLDDRVPLQETPAVLAEAIAQAVRGMRWQGCTNPREPPLLILGPEPSSTAVLNDASGDGEVGGAAVGLALGMADEWGLTHLATGKSNDTAAASAAATAAVGDAAATLLTGMRLSADKGKRCVLSATPSTLPAALRALSRFRTERPHVAPRNPNALPGTPLALDAEPSCVAFVTVGGKASYEAEQLRTTLRASGVANAESIGAVDRADALAQAAGVIVRSSLIRPGAVATPRSSLTSSDASSSSSALHPPHPKPSGLIVVSGADVSPDGSLCAKLASRLGAAHIALPSLLRGQLAAVQKTAGAKESGKWEEAVRAGILPQGGGEEASSLTESVRAGKLISASSTLRAVQTALHAAPEGLLLVQHSWADTPLESLVAKIRPSLVLLVRPSELDKKKSGGSTLAEPKNRGGSLSDTLTPRPDGWANPLHDVEARQAYELRSIEALGESAPQVRLCGRDVDEASKLIFEFLSRPCADDDVATDEEDELYGASADDRYQRRLGLRPLAKAAVDLE